MGHQYENDIAKEMYRGTDKLIYPIRAGYSGNGAYPLPDLAIYDHSTTILHMVEVKGVIQSDTVTIEESELEDLETMAGPNGRSWIVVKFQNRCPLTAPILEVNNEEFDSVADKVVFIMENMGFDGFNPRVNVSKDTGIVRLYIDKPELDDWPSAQASDEDYVEILKGMGIYNE